MSFESDANVIPVTVPRSQAELEDPWGPEWNHAVRCLGDALEVSGGR